MSEPSTNKRSTVVSLAVGAFVIVLLLGTCAFQVRVTEIAMVSTLGRPGQPIQAAGLHAKAPWPIQRVYRFDRRTQLFQGDYQEVLTRDNVNLIVKLYATWQIADAVNFYESVGFETAEGVNVLGGLIDKYVGDVMSTRTLGDFVATDADQAARFDTIENEILKRVAEEADKYGIGIRTVAFEHLGLPETITTAVFDRMMADRERLTSQIRSEGERDARLIRTEADRQKAEILSQAEAEAMKIRGQGESEAFEHFKVFQEDPEFALFLRKLETLEKTLRKKTTLILDRDVPPYDLLKANIPVLKNGKAEQP